jgi:TetR/AcrR family fatty acid metabolism transcriptional regulator
MAAQQKQIEIKAPRSVKRQQEKNRIFEAAMQLMREYGYDYVTVSNVCKVAGISTGNFYHYFQSKDELLSQFFINSYERFMEEHEDSKSDDPIEDIIAFFCEYSDFCEKQGVELMRNFYVPTNSSLDMSNGSTETGFALPSLERAAKQIEEAQEEGYFDPKADAHQMAEDICTIEKGAVFDWCVCGGTHSLVPEVRRLLTHYLMSYKVQ